MMYSLRKRKPVCDKQDGDGDHEDDGDHEEDEDSNYDVDTDADADDAPLRQRQRHRLRNLHSFTALLPSKDLMEQYGPKIIHGLNEYGITEVAEDMRPAVLRGFLISILGYTYMKDMEIMTQSMIKSMLKYKFETTIDIEMPATSPGTSPLPEELLGNPAFEDLVDLVHNNKNLQNILEELLE